MKDIIRDAALGQVLRYVAGNSILLYPEECPDFQYPYRVAAENRNSTEEAEQKEQSGANANTASTGRDIEQHGTQYSPGQGNVDESSTRESLATVVKATSRKIEPTRTKDGIILIDWYSNGTC
jgi:DHA1 family multidrug resistance protein-like MFS transporter